MHRLSPIRCLVLLAAGVLVAACGSDRVTAPGSGAWPSGYQPPIAGATFPLAARHLPGGAGDDPSALPDTFEFVDGVAGRPLPPGTEVVSVAAGVVVQLERTQERLTAEEREFLAEQVRQGGSAREQAIDRLRGRQVWVEHEDGYISRYSELSAVDDSLKIGQQVGAGDVLGRIGEMPPSPDSGQQPDSVAPPRLRFELLDPDGEALGAGRTPLEIHTEVAAVFGPDALPRHAREIIEAIESGQPAPESYPPDPIPRNGFSVQVPEEVSGGTARAAAVTWQDDDFTPDSFFANLNGLTLGFIDAGNGAWLLLPAPRIDQGVDATLTIGGTDRYGQSLIGQRSVGLVPATPESPLEQPTAVYEEYSDEALRNEARVLAQAVVESLGIRQPLWQDAFQPPAEGRIVRDFGQEIVSGVLRPDFPNPGIDLRTEGESGVMASNAGRVALVETLPLRGRTVALIHGGGLISVYAGLDLVAVEPGQQVARGQVLGSVGSPEEGGRFRWEMHLAGIPVDPRVWSGRVLPPKSE